VTVETSAVPLRLLTASAIRAARACARYYHNLYNLGVRPVDDADELGFGTLIHRGLEAWWQYCASGGHDTFTLGAALDAIRGHADPFELARARAMLRAYHRRWLRAAPALEVLGVEVQFETPLVNPMTNRASRTWRLAGKIDVLVRDELRRELIVEHKTSAEDLSSGSEYWRRLQLDTQISMYYAGARALGHDPRGVIYDVLGKTRHRPLKATSPEDRKYTKDGALYAKQRDRDETPEEYEARLDAIYDESAEVLLQRRQVVRLEAEEREFAWEAWQYAQRIREDERAERHPRNPDSCSRYGRACAFLDACAGLADLDDPARFRKGPIHPELQEASHG